MPRITIVAAMIAGAVAFADATALAQGVAPGGGIANSAGIGSGTGVTGTGPRYPNGTPPPVLPSPAPPGSGGGATAPPPAITTFQPSLAPQPRTWSGRMPPPATEPLMLPDQPTEDLAFLRGCWRSDVFQYEQQAGISTWCFDGKGVGRFLYTRLNQPNYFCHAQAQAGYEGQVLQLHSLTASCNEGGDLAPEYLACQPGGGQTAQCSGNPSAQNPAGSWTVRLSASAAKACMLATRSPEPRRAVPCAAAADYITGQELVIAGGMTAGGRPSRP
jgi:hypothetical protein